MRWAGLIWIGSRGTGDVFFTGCRALPANTISTRFNLHRHLAKSLRSAGQIAIGNELSAWIVDLFSGEAADFGCAAAHAAAAQLDPLERAVRRRWLAAAASALVIGAYAAQVVVPAAETSLAPIAGIAPSYGPKTVSAVPNAAAIVRRIWLPQLDAGYDPQGLAVDDGAIYVSAYRSDSLGVRRGPCRVIRIDLETGGSTGYVDVPSPCGHAGGLAVGGDGMLYVADTHTLFATPLVHAFDRGARFRQFSLGPGVIGGLAASTPDGIWLGTYEDGPGRLFRFTAATLARLSDGQTLEASQAATVLTIPDHAQGAAIGAGGYGSRAAIGTGARSIGSTLLPARRSAVMKSRPVPRVSPSAMPADCGRCRRPGRGISTTIPSSTCSNRFSRWSSRSTSLAWSESDYIPPPAVGWDLGFESGLPPAESHVRAGLSREFAFT